VGSLPAHTRRNSLFQLDNAEALRFLLGSSFFFFAMRLHDKLRLIASGLILELLLRNTSIRAAVGNLQIHLSQITWLSADSGTNDHIRRMTASRSAGYAPPRYTRQICVSVEADSLVSADEVGPIAVLTGRNPLFQLDDAEALRLLPGAGLGRL
jgi:hypothetical protein